MSQADKYQQNAKVKNVMEDGRVAITHFQKTKERKHQAAYMKTYWIQNKKDKRIRGTGFERVCCVCYEFKSMSVCTYNADNFCAKEKQKYCTFNHLSVNTDGKYHVCTVCKTLKSKEDPIKIQEFYKSYETSHSTWTKTY